jgi:dTDP-4-dehydrorhamnose reductase
MNTTKRLPDSVEVIVLGASGQLGSELIEVLQNKQIVVLGFTSMELDVTDYVRVNEVISEYKPSLLFNCSAYTKVDKAEDEWDKALAINGHAVGNLADICNKNGIKLIHFSTDYIFSGSMEDMQHFVDGYIEGDKPAPKANYAISKYLGELYIREKLSDYLIIRVAWLCGKNGNNFIKTMLRLAKDYSELKVVGDQFGSPSFTENVIENTIVLLSKKANGTFHISSTGITNWAEFAAKAFEIKGLSTKVIPIESSQWPSPVKRPFFSKLSTQKIAPIEGIKLVHWSHGLKRLLDSLTD